MIKHFLLVKYLYHLLYRREKALTGLMTHLAQAHMNRTLFLDYMLHKVEIVVNKLESIIIY
jgi:hypothetical protein